MRFSTIFAAFGVLASGVTAQNTSFLVSSDSIGNALLLVPPHYNSPNPPWVAGSQPGWYYGQGSPPEGILCILQGLFCEILELLPFCLHCPKPPPPPPPHKPPPPPEYTPTFYNLTCASQDSSFQTFGLVDTVADCEAMCDTVPGCTFVNAYHDNNDAGKGDSPLLTCSLFTQCLDASTADNCAGQGQPNGGVDFITDSGGYCKKTPTAAT
ncbi:hypothetical protein C8F01DRAFT_1128939 [Mycena amicta]|nr:hypothetical protein C8F01DRAFT_1128939 [Mycena amicta]